MSDDITPYRVDIPEADLDGFSAKPAQPGWGTRRIADAWGQLMARLGYPPSGRSASQARP